MITWIGLGGNIGHGRAVLEEALEKIDCAPGLEVRRTSGFYASEPWGYSRQGEFTNAVAEVASLLEPLVMLQELQRIERDMGRRRDRGRWGPRRIDLDILLIGDRILVLEELTVPHPRMHRRAFVLLPLAELEPGLVIPGRGTVRACLGRVGSAGVRNMAGA